MNRIGEPHERHDIIENKPVKEICNDPRCPMNRMGLKHEIHENGWFNESAEADTSQMGDEHGSSIPPKHSGKKTDRKPTRNVPAENVQSGERTGNPRRIHSTGKISHPPNDLGPADKAAEDRILNSNDPYVVLGVPKNATGAEIKSAHRNLVKMFHPSKGALHKSVAEQARYDQIMKEINRAYGQIKNPRSSYTRHAQYTAPRKNPEAETTQRPPGDPLSDIVEEIWQGALSSSRRRERSDDPTERRILTSDDPYIVLGVSRNTSYQDIQTRYLDLAMTYGERVKASRRSNAASRYKEIMTKINNAFEHLKKDHTSSETHLDDLADAILRDAMPDNHRQPKRADKENTQPSSDLGSADKATEDRILNSDDPYVVLGVSRNTSYQDIQNSYLDLAMTYGERVKASRRSNAASRYKEIMTKINNAFEHLKKDHTSSETHLDDLADAILRDAMPDNHRQPKRADKENTQPSSDLGSADKATEDRILNSDDPYVVLGVSRNATRAEIKSAHRNLVKIFHPSKGALHKSVAEQERSEQIMKEINHAYEQYLKRTRKGGQT